MPIIITTPIYREHIPLPHLSIENRFYFYSPIYREHILYLSEEKHSVFFQHILTNTF